MEGYELQLDAFFAPSKPSIPADLDVRTIPLAELYTNIDVSIKSDKKIHAKDKLLAEHRVTNREVAYCGSLKSAGQSDNLKMFDRADFQMDTDERLIRMERRSLVVRAKCKRSRDSNWPNI